MTHGEFGGSGMTLSFSACELDPKRIISQQRAMTKEEQRRLKGARVRKAAHFKRVGIAFVAGAALVGWVVVLLG